jgi:hypothetical protein
MLRLGKIYDHAWEEILAEAEKYSVRTSHPAKLQFTETKLVYWHNDGLLHGFWHAIIDHDPATLEVTLTRGHDRRARSEIESYRFLDELLNITKKRVQGSEDHDQDSRKDRDQ